ncbi:MAG TPA: rRNA maturation RNase YbeY [bacterium]|nr:rRNA maturation RNase YbeY [bacterium]
MRLLFVNKTGADPVSRGWVLRLSRLVLRRVKGPSFERGAELSVTWVGDAEMKELNRSYRGKAKTTDVLSFPLLEGRRMPRAPKGPLPLGDVVVSLPQAARQAKERGVPMERELALLVVHGILHLLGHDHVTVRQEKRMFGLQERLLKGFKP